MLVEHRRHNPRHPHMGEVAAVLPAYNEERHVEQAVTAALEAGLAHVVCVNDGSADGTAGVIDGLAARHPGVQAVHHPENRGKQAAVKTGLGLAVECPRVDMVAVLDADMQNDPAHLPHLCAHCSGYDMVVGRRRQDQMPTIRRVANALANMPYNLLAGLPISDVQSGFRVYSRPAAQYLARHLPVHGRYALEHTAMLLCARLARQQGRDFRVAEVTISCPYGSAASSIRLRDNLQLTFASLYYAASLALLRL